MNIMPPLVAKSENRSEIEQEKFDAMLEDIDHDDPMSALSKEAQQDYLDRLESIKDELVEEGAKAVVTWSAANRRPCVRKYLHEAAEKSIWPERFTEQYFLKQKVN